MKATIQEWGNGFPRVGDYVVGYDGELYRVTSMDTRIFTGNSPGEPNYLYAEVELADWSDIEDDKEPITCTAVV